MPDRPTYLERGLFLTQEEFDIVSISIATTIEQIERGGSHDIDRIRGMKALVRRLHQIVHAGEGMTPEIAERYTARIAAAMRKGDSDAIADATASLLAAGIRLDPDPAQFLANVMMGQLNQSIPVISSALLAKWLGNLQTCIAEVKDSWEEDAYPSAAEAIQWVMDTLASGLDDVQTGHEPWAVIAEDEDPANSAAADDVTTNTSSETEI